MLQLKRIATTIFKVNANRILHVTALPTELSPTLPSFSCFCIIFDQSQFTALAWKDIYWEKEHVTRIVTIVTERKLLRTVKMN